MPEARAEEAATREESGRPGGRGKGADAGQDAGAGPGGEASRPRRRQARGEARIAQLLEAAADVFCASGYNGASTNAIAREAGVSPGTLYQFFPNKEAIAIELGEQLMHRWRETYGAAFVVRHIELPLDRLLDTVLDPLIAFNCENPAFAVLTHGSEIPGVITREHDALHATMLTRTEELLAAYLPELPADQVTRTAEMAFVLFKAGLDLVMSHEGTEREAYVEELKTVMYRYLEPLACDTPDRATARSSDTP
ncbi:TetR/AcrR family transcriptional regulator [Streptomyces sp. JH34]|uniref:TetR/AcrR family transcriptional regulator n=1 Tax=Streptomyces sp. JH34 TaxID=2793633 RepID=UPI0023F9B86A|nr:TetR/AcrR family transcriptional regulator [Streptomyces sp. JH34]MDF6021062.1 TetR family transcriptional regulator [Streptomyces sp. JH34]